eukprot:gene4092-8134_t
MRSYFHSDVDHKCPTSSVFNGASNNISSTRYSIGILVIYKDDGNNQWGDSLMKRILVNREKYAAKHGYKVINGNDLIDSSRPVAWSKLKAVEAHLSSFDYIFYIDMDAIIMNMNRPLHDFIQIANNHHKTHEETTSPSPSPPIDLIMTADWNGPNTGVWLARNSTWTHWFLNLLWEQKQFTQEKSPSGTPYPFEYEQRAFHYILDTNIWRKRKLPRYSGNSAEIRNHVVVLPQCTFNSYSLHPFDGRGRFDEAQYVEGDFIIHFAGKKDGGGGKFDQIGAENVVGIEICDVLQCIEILDGYSKGYKNDINQADKMGQAMVVHVKSANLLNPNKGQATKIGNELYGRMTHQGV